MYSCSSKRKLLRKKCGVTVIGTWFESFLNENNFLKPTVHSPIQFFPHSLIHVAQRRKVREMRDLTSDLEKPVSLTSKASREGEFFPITRIN
jgi:hypothetical protein